MLTLVVVSLFTQSTEINISCRDHQINKKKQQHDEKQTQRKLTVYSSVLRTYLVLKEIIGYINFKVAIKKMEVAVKFWIWLRKWLIITFLQLEPWLSRCYWISVITSVGAYCSSPFSNCLVNWNSRRVITNALILKQLTRLVSCSSYWDE